jgi:hypothetical protein
MALLTEAGFLSSPPVATPTPLVTQLMSVLRDTFRTKGCLFVLTVGRRAGKVSRPRKSNAKT